MGRSTVPTIVITGGGTAGHVFPGLAVAEALVGDGYSRSQVSFVGSKRGMEATLVPDAGFEITLLGGRGVVRRLSPQNIGALFGLMVAYVRSVVYMVRHRPRVVVSVGGYASVPCALAGVLLRIPIIVVNVDAVPGLANRIVGRFAVRCAVALPGTPLPRTVVTGAPLREEIEQVTRSEDERNVARDKLVIAENARVVVVTGGSLGARQINRATLSLAHMWKDRQDVVIIHLVGERNLATVEDELSVTEIGPNYRYLGFSDDMPTLLRVADVMVCRAGAMTVAELTLCGAPSILVPLPGAPNDHQRKNAEVLVENGAAAMIEDAVLDGTALSDMLLLLLDDAQRLHHMSNAARTLGRPKAAQAIARLVANVVNGN
jgi:undecaprenyldiphospho-muramoylpentapeptide beta-N-acetylglucosaminyltransferase